MIPARQFGCLGLFVGLTALVAVLAWAVLRFSTPLPERIAVGQVKDFPPGQAPRLFSAQGVYFYVLNLEGELVALSARSERGSRCLVHWQDAEHAYVDPCLGTHHAIDGAYKGKGPPSELSRLPLQVMDGQVRVEIGYR